MLPDLSKEIFASPRTTRRNWSPGGKDQHPLPCFCSLSISPRKLQDATREKEGKIQRRSSLDHTSPCSCLFFTHFCAKPRSSPLQCLRSGCTQPFGCTLSPRPLHRWQTGHNALTKRALRLLRRLPTRLPASFPASCCILKPLHNKTWHPLPSLLPFWSQR